MNLKKILIIGGTGFFGKSLVNYFINKKSKKKTQIIIFARKVKKFKLINDNKNLSIKKIKGNILNTKTLPKANLVIYCALSKKYKDDIRAIKNFCFLSKKYYRNSKIIYVSSGAIYGILPRNINRVKEEYSSDNRNKFNNYKKNYSMAKKINELQIQDLGKCGLNVAIARCFTFVGEMFSQNSNFAIIDFINCVLKKRKIILKAKHKVIRSYMHADDLAFFLLKILNFASNNCPIFNCGSDHGVSFNQLLNFLSKKYNVKLDKKKYNYKNKYIDLYVPNINKFRKEFKFYKKLNSFKAIEKTIYNLKKRQIGFYK
jgi:dTDP-glucose 4,6-dehydratase